MPAHFGLDIGTYSIKLIHAEKKGNNFKLINWGEIKTPADPSSDSEKDQQLIAEAIKKLKIDCKISLKNVVVSIPETDVYTQVIELPNLSQTELQSALNFEAEQYIPVPLEEIQLEYIITKTPPKGSIENKMEIMLLGAKKRAVERLLSILEKAELFPIAAETETFSITRLFELLLYKNGIILDLGYRKTNVAIIKDQNLNFVRTIPNAGEAITRAIATNLSMEIPQAEQYKLSYGIDEQQLEGKVAKAVIPVMNIIIEDLQRAIAFYNQKHQITNIGPLYLIGGGAQMHGLSAYLAKSINSEIIVSNPFANCLKDDKLPKGITSTSFSVALGLALRENE